MSTKTNCLLALLAFSFTVPGYCESDSKAAPDAKPMRTRADGMKAYYEPGAVKKDGDKVIFKTFSSPDPAKDQGDEYSINCKTHEMASKEGGAKEWSAPSPLLAGESPYPLAKKLCEWDKKGFWQKMTE